MLVSEVSGMLIFLYLNTDSLLVEMIEDDNSKAAQINSVVFAGSVVFQGTISKQNTLQHRPSSFCLKKVYTSGNVDIEFISQV